MAPTPEEVQPLRITKASPMKGRPLSEISPMERRRNSPSWNPVTKKMLGSRESSPFDTSGLQSPLNSSTNGPPGASSPRAFWAKRDPASPFNENSDHSRLSDSPSIVRRRSSIEKLKLASRVKNSSMFAREHRRDYDPSQAPIVERPLASGRPLSLQYTGFGAIAKSENNPPYQPMEFSKGHRRGESMNKVPLVAPTSPGSPENNTLLSSPDDSQMEQSHDFRKESASPVHRSGSISPSKSSMVQRPNHHNTFPRSFEPQPGGWSEENSEAKISPPRALRRQAKSVTFDAAPPQINEYEMVTPDPSSVASGSREGSYEIEDDDEYDMYPSYNHNPAGLIASIDDVEDSFDASLEDTDKTPVVLPEDWRHMSPEQADTALAAGFEDPFDPRNDEEHDPAATPSKPASWDRNASIGSDGQSRPLPPPPPGVDAGELTPRRGSGMSSVVDRVHHAHRSLPAPPAAARFSKSDILSMKENSLSLEERLSLMGLRENSAEHSPDASANGNSSRDQAAREKARLQRHGLGIHMHEEEIEVTEERTTEIKDFKFPRISRESILRKVRSRTFDVDDEPEQDYDIDNLDPDIPIPSREASSNFDEVVPDQAMKHGTGEHTDMYSISERPSMERGSMESEGSVICHRVGPQDQDSVSCYSPAEPNQEREEKVYGNDNSEDDDPPTPRASASAGISTSTPRLDAARGGELPEFSSILDDSEFNSYLSNESQRRELPPHPHSHGTSHANGEYHHYQQRDVSPEEGSSASSHTQEPGSPSSVLHHRIGAESPVSLTIPDAIATIKAPGGKLRARPSATPADIHTMAAARRQVSGTHAPPPIPEKSPKRFSFSIDTDGPLPPLPHPSAGEAIDNSIENAVEAHRKRRESFKIKVDIPEDEDLSLDLNKEFERVIESSKVDLMFPIQPYASSENYSESHISGNFHMYCSQQIDKFSTDITFRSKKGYLMRQNTKVVVAKRTFSNETSSLDGDRPASADDATLPQLRNASKGGATSSGRPGHERTRSWQTEPWNGQIRRKSFRDKRAPVPNGPVPPLPGMDSVVAGLDTVMEDQIPIQEEPEDGAGRGLLFVKVVGVKDVNLPFPRSERTYFQLTLDNGLHCVTTTRLELGRSAPIGQEFELVVLNDLEFQLTLQALITPPEKPVPVLSSKPVQKPPSKKSSFSRLLSSPKKRREADRQAREAREEEERRQREAVRLEKAQQAERAANPGAWDLLHELVSEEDGSFGRAYVCLKNHEGQCYGRPINVDMPLFNEWALETDGAIVSSMKSKRGLTGGQLRKPPYEIGKLSLQLLYVPRVKGMTDEDMPKSMNACVREMAAAERVAEAEWEGYLSQQGGDCPYWRRRFFRLAGSKLTAFHEVTRQPRVGISLAGVVKLIDDKTTLLQPDGGAKRRKSAFSEEDQAYMFVEEGFRIRFANGEAIDFYADTAAEKDAWMRVLALAIGKDGPGACSSSSSSSSAAAAATGSSGKWCQAVLARESVLRERAERVERAAAGPGALRPRSAGKMMDGFFGEQGQPRGSRSVPTSPVKREGPGRRAEQVDTVGGGPAPHAAMHGHHRPGHRGGGGGSGGGPTAAPRTSSRRAQIKSMIF